MSINQTIFLGSDHGIRVGGVTAFADPETGIAVNTGTVTGRLYDKSKTVILTGTTDGAGATPTIVQLKSVTNWIVGDAIELWLDNGAFHNTTVASIAADTDQITLTAAVASPRLAYLDTFAKRKLGSDISMTLYGGTPAASVDTWGWDGPVADTHEGLYLGKKVSCEVDIDDGAGRRRIIRFDARVVK